jgi:hypothetical protein
VVPRTAPAAVQRFSREAAARKPQSGRALVAHTGPHHEDGRSARPLNSDRGRRPHPHMAITGCGARKPKPWRSAAWTSYRLSSASDGWLGPRFALASRNEGMAAFSNRGRALTYGSTGAPWSGSNRV